MQATDGLAEVLEKLDRARVRLRTLEGLTDARQGIAQWLHTRARRRELEIELELAITDLGASVLERVLDGSITVAPTPPACDAGATASTDVIAPTEPVIAASPSPEAAAPAMQPAPDAEPAQPPTTTPLLGTPSERLRHALANRDLPSTPAPVMSGPEQRARDDVRRALRPLLAVPPRLAEPAGPEAEIARMVTFVRDTRTVWASLGIALNHAICTWVAARLRAAQHAQGVRPRDEPRESTLTRCVRELAEHTASTRPGVVHGLALVHEPRLATWAADAAAAETVVRERLDMPAARSVASEPAGPKVDDLVRRLHDAARDGISEPEFCRRVRELTAAGLPASDKRLARLALAHVDALRVDGQYAVARAAEALADDEARTDDSTPNRVPADWPHRALTQDRRAAIVGGEPRADRIERLKAEFGFASLEWIDNPTGGGRNVDALVQRMRNGSLDLVIVLRGFSSHKVSDKIFDNRDTPCLVVLADTYGVTQVKLGIERFAPTAR